MAAGLYVYLGSLLTTLLFPFIGFLNYPGRAFWVLAFLCAVNLIGAHMTIKHYT
jgi:hypothetical protein